MPGPSIYDRLGTVEGLEEKRVEVTPGRFLHPKSAEIRREVMRLSAGEIAQGHIIIPRLDTDTDAGFQKIINRTKNNIRSHGSAIGIKIVARAFEPTEEGGIGNYHIYFEKVE